MFEWESPFNVTVQIQIPVFIWSKLWKNWPVCTFKTLFVNHCICLSFFCFLRLCWLLKMLFFRVKTELAGNLVYYKAKAAVILYIVEESIILQFSSVFFNVAKPTFIKHSMVILSSGSLGRLLCLSMKWSHYQLFAISSKSKRQVYDTSHKIHSKCLHLWVSRGND